MNQLKVAAGAWLYARQQVEEHEQQQKGGET